MAESVTMAESGAATPAAPPGAPAELSHLALKSKEKTKYCNLCKNSISAVNLSILACGHTMHWSKCRLGGVLGFLIKPGSVPLEECCRYSLEGGGRQ